MNAMSGGGGGPAPGTPNIVSVVGPDDVDEGSAATITVTTENFPDGDTTLDWTISQNASDFVVSSGTVVIKAGAISTVFQEVSGATVDIEKETGDDVYTYSFGGTLASEPDGLGFGYPLLLNQRIGSSSYYRGTSTGVFDQYRVNRRVTVGGDGIDTFTVTPELDGVVEGPETFTVTVSGTVDGTPVTRTSSPITINDINNATPIPAGTFTGRPAPAPGSTAWVAYCRSEEVSDEGQTVTATARVSTSIYSDDFGPAGDGFRIVVQAVAATDTSQWYTPTGTANPLSSTPVEIYRNANVTPTAVRIVYRLVAADGTHIGSDVNLGWQPAGPGDTASFSRSASAGAGADSFRGGTIEVDFYGRADGFLDTLLATFQYRVEAYADGANF